jgi:hypothetical protein
VWRWEATRRDAVVHLDATAGTGRVARTGRVEGWGDIYNEITISYRPEADGDSRWGARRMATAAALRLTRGRASTDDGRVLGYGLLVDSQATFGVRPLSLEVAWVWDDTTAELLLRDRVLAHAWPRRRVEYQGGPWLETLRVGDAVTVTDPELHLTDALALVYDLTPGEVVTVELLLLDHPLQS